ncbi:hypothetical protein N7481_002502 [Penicillium waksmanii]|uniref:uncharacterized protein n=1 Tax=Penicillium waksmanii TaxID=69791 RepID=UPI002546E3E8|nr:uncharacterized protein N7481_002502 [Penicillium waksmanii]KAJ5995525.1 hypothetical protein N7481_002502 [Penicillium waksmanii]
MSPFVRTRAPELEQQHGLSPNELLTFIDALNESFLANPALQAVGAVGNIVGFVPLASTQIASGAMSLAAGLGAAGVSFVRTKRFMKRANETIFKPKGLHVQLCKTDKMLNHIGMANHGAVFAGQQSQATLENAQTEAGQNPISRRMEVLGDRVTRLSFDDVDAPIAPENWMQKVGAYSAQRAESKQLEKLNKKQVKSERKSGKHERKASKAEKKQSRADEKVESIMEEMEEIRVRMQSLDSTSRRYEKAHKELRKEWKELEKDLREAERDQCRGGRKSRKVDEKSQKRLHKDGRKVNKILWIVIMPVSECASSDDDEWDSDESMEKNHDS